MKAIVEEEIHADKLITISHWCFLKVANNVPENIFFKDFIYLFLERGQGREKARKRNIDVWEQHWSVASCTRPDQGPHPQPRQVLWPEMGPATFHFVGQGPTNWATPVRAQRKLKKKKANNVPEKILRIANNIPEKIVFKRKRFWKYLVQPILLLLREAHRRN